MKDFIGNEINIGDIVVALAHHSTSSCLYKGEIIRLTDKMVVLKVFNPEKDWKLKDEMKVCPDKVVKILQNPEKEYMELGKQICKINSNNTSYIKDIEEKITRLEKLTGYSFDEILSQFLQGYTLKLSDYLGVPTSFLEKYGK